IVAIEGVAKTVEEEATALRPDMRRLPLLRGGFPRWKGVFATLSGRIQPSQELSRKALTRKPPSSPRVTTLREESEACRCSQGCDLPFCPAEPTGPTQF